MGKQITQEEFITLFNENSSYPLFPELEGVQLSRCKNAYFETIYLLAVDETRHYSDGELLYFIISAEEANNLLVDYIQQLESDDTSHFMDAVRYITDEEEYLIDDLEDEEEELVEE
ncbi:hypothetical protein [Sporosarcina beigongshangi]|uniref:hypothetical protein n=1 Tax=Sporosarcina beigongshangi TaxID=2782538 RepID=UPI001939829E|nr:hypothetical protein [Sporosarcina beigongshangi]